MTPHDIDKTLFMQMVQAPVADLTSGTAVPATYIDVSGYAWFAFLLMVGATDRTAQKIQVVQATASDGTGSKNITDAVTTALGATDDNKMVMVVVKATSLDINNSFRYVAVTPTWTGGNAGLGAILFMGYRPREIPVTQPAAFAEVVRV